jgi:hypothetical protein
MLPALEGWHQTVTNVPGGMELEGGTTMQLPTVFRSSSFAANVRGSVR